MTYKDKNYWALILGGSSGIGLASAKKLAELGINIYIVHRDRRGAMTKINEGFDIIKSKGVKLESFNTNALTAEGRDEVIAGIKETIGGGKIRLMLHSIALGNLKLIAPLKREPSATLAKLAASFNTDVETLQKNIDGLFDAGESDDLVALATKPAYSEQNFTGEDDMSQTIYNMGTSLLSWTQDIHKAELFADDSRVLGLTSEGNEIAWRGYAAVAAAKCALESVSRAIAVEFAPFGIRSNILQPGITDTPALRLIPGSPQMKANAVCRNPFGRITRPEDVANVVSMMARDEASWINGTIIRVDGGEHISG
jgi:NAD(P)-dependent dehydrogenase (short-subunit alcohol dehydrogenase family)